MVPTSCRVALLSEFGSLNGGEHSLLALIPEIRARGFEPVALAPAKGRLAAALAEHQIPHVAFSMRDDRTTAVERLADAFDRTAATLLHANSLSMGRLSGRLAQATGHPTTTHLRDILNLSNAAIADLNANRRLLAVSQATRNHHVAAGLDARRTLVVYNGVDPNRFRRRQTGRGWLRRELGISRPSLLVATIGQLGLRKALDVLAEATVQVSATVDYLVIGERYSKKDESVVFEADAFERFLEAAPTGRLHRLGYRTDIAGILSEIDLLVHPARQEPLGRVLLEAAVSGCAILATDVGGTAEILVDNETALLVAPDDAGALAGGIDRLAGDESLRKRLGTAAREDVATRFTIEAAADGLTAAWEAALQSEP